MRLATPLSSNQAPALISLYPPPPLRTHLADPAALLVSVLVEGEHALGAHQLHRLLGIREGVLDADAVVLLNSVKQLVRLGVEAASVQAAGCTGNRVTRVCCGLRVV